MIDILNICCIRINYIYFVLYVNEVILKLFIQNQKYTE